MAKILSLDYGQRKVGVALGDDVEGYVVTKSALTRRDDQSLFTAIQELVRSEDIGRVIVGLPLTLAGGRSAQTELTERFIAALRDALSIPVTSVDERFTTQQARAAIRPGDDDDSAAAALLLTMELERRVGR